MEATKLSARIFGMRLDKEIKKETSQERYRKKNLKKYANYQKLYRRRKKREALKNKEGQDVIGS